MRDREDGVRAERARFKQICLDKLALADQALAHHQGTPFFDDSYCAAVTMSQDVLRDIIRQIEPKPTGTADADVIHFPTPKGDGDA